MSVLLKQLIEWMEQKSDSLQWLIFALIIALILASSALVLATGGTQVVYVHTMYLPIILASLVFGIRGGILASLIGGLMLGPFVPVDVDTGLMQTQSAWLIRTGFFLLLGILTGAFADLVRFYLRQIRWRLFNNETTQLPNKLSLLQYIEKIKASKDEEVSANHLYLIDVINLEDNVLKLGAKVEALTLGKLAKRLEEDTDDSTACFHLRNGKFALVGGELNEIRPVIHEVLATPISYEGIPLLLNYVWSSVSLNDDVDDTEEYLRRVEVSLTEARRRNQNYFGYTPGLEQFARENVELLGLFKRALDDNDLYLHYQPKYRFSDQNTFSIEALVRWNDPLRGLISPGKFIPLVEDSSLIDPLTLWVIDRALADFTSLQREQINLESVAVNISAINLLADNFVENIRAMLAKHRLNPSVLELELTENAVMSDINDAVLVLNKIADYNIKLSIDDYGTGFSSLQYLDRLPISSLKIDQMFVKNMLADPNKHHIVETTAELAKRLELSLIAEGVESQEMEDALVDLGCEYGQGFHFGRPMSLPDLKKFLKQREEKEPLSP